METINKLKSVLLFASLIIFVILYAIMVISTLQSVYNHTLTEDTKFISNSFRTIEQNWSSTQPILMDTAEESLPVTRYLVDVLANDYPCANEQFVLLSKENEVIPTKTNYASPVQMSIGFPDTIPAGSYVIHSHPLQTCGDFSIREIATFPSPADLIAERNHGIDNIIVVTKTSNETAIASRVHGYIEAPEDTLATYAFLTNGIGFNKDITLQLFQRANISCSFFTIIITPSNDTIIVHQVTDSII